MARIIKTRTKKPLAEGLLLRSWSRDYDAQKTETFSLYVKADETPTGEARYVSLKMSPKELREIMVWAAPFFVEEYRGGDLHGLRKKPSEAFREIAEELERAGK